MSDLQSSLVSWTPQRIKEVIQTCSSRTGPERNLAEDLVNHLKEAGVSHMREVTLTRGRVDLKIEDIAIELKVKGTPQKVLHQLWRYALDNTVTTVILVTSSRKLAAQMPKTIGTKPLEVVYLNRL